MIHSLVAYVDGSMLAQLGNPDMRTPIAHALAHPDRIEAGVAPLDLCRIGSLDFERPDMDRFPCLRLAYEVLARGGNAPAVLNAANEIAVEAFLERRLAFDLIPIVIEQALRNTAWMKADNLDIVMEADAAARKIARKAVDARARPA